MVLLTLLLVNGSCMNSGTSHLRGPKDESGYQILSKAQADELFRKIRSQNADLEIVRQFFMNKSFYLKSVQALTQASHAACIALYSAAGDSERLGILAIKLQGDVVVETTSGIIWLTAVGGDIIASELEEGPKLTSTSTVSLIGWWNCVFNQGGWTRSLRKGHFYPPCPGCLVARLKGSSGSPLVYHWFRRCY
jgi:hypothetical protein